jgi:hypothetical protein
MIKKTLILLLLFPVPFIYAQKPAGVFGKRNTIGLSFDASVFRLSRYTNSKLVIPTLQYTRIQSQRRSFSLELGVFTVNLRGNEEGGNDERLKWSPQRYTDVRNKGTGKAGGIVFGAYRHTNWRNIGPVGPYHTWGIHFASIKYKSDAFSYTANDYSRGQTDTFYKAGRPSRRVLSVSIAFGSKTQILKSDRLTWDYGIRCRVPIGGFYEIYERFFDGREYLVYHGVKSYIGSSFVMFYTGLHFAF